ncbi:MAG: hypothetical protein PVJ27_09295 [Candidatus Brocadiaceae bacterium]|jgi:hypothetical protein
MNNGLPSQEKRVIKAGEVAFGSEPARIPVGDVAPRHRPQPAVEEEPEINIDRAEDGTVRTIEVRCTCGRTISLQCEYFEQGGEDEAEVS